MAHVLIALGSNLGERSRQLQQALDLLAQDARLQVLRVSQFLETRPAGGPEQAAYLNAAARLEFDGTPAEFWQLASGVEQTLGRQRLVHWGPRTIDLDLLLWDQHLQAEPTLVLPHPRMAYRRFVLQPAAEIAADWVHPAIGWTLGKLWAHAQSPNPLVALTGPADWPAVLQQPGFSQQSAVLLFGPTERAAWQACRHAVMHGDEPACPAAAELSCLSEWWQQVQHACAQAQAAAQPRWVLAEGWPGEFVLLARRRGTSIAQRLLTLLTGEIEPRLPKLIAHLAQKQPQTYEGMLSGWYKGAGPVCWLHADTPHPLNGMPASQSASLELSAALAGLSGD